MTMTLPPPSKRLTILAAALLCAAILMVPMASFGQGQHKASFVISEYDRMICKGTPFKTKNTLEVVEGGWHARICIKYTAKNWPIDENWSIPKILNDLSNNGTPTLPKVRTPLRYTVSVDGNSKGWWINPAPSTEAKTRGWDTIEPGDMNTATYTEIIEILVSAKNNFCNDPVDKVTIKVSFKHESQGGGGVAMHSDPALDIIAERKDDEDGSMVMCPSN